MQEISNIKIQKAVGAHVVSEVPKVSVITPAYNISEFIAETLESVFAQTFQEFEIILINDGSPDTEKFERVLAPFLDRIVYLKIENLGAGAARNVAIENARGEYLAFLDGDDVWLPQYLAAQIAFLEENALDMVYCDADFFGELADANKTYMQTTPSNGAVTFESVLDLRCNLITSGTLARREKVIEAGMFEWEKARAHDFHLWLRLLKNGARVDYQRKVLLKYRVHLESLSGDSVQRVEREIDVYHRVLRKIELLPNEKEIVKKHLKRLKFQLEIERGKSFLLAEDYASAEKSFVKANEHKKSFRLQIIIALLKIAPRLLLKIYRLRRADDIRFVPQSQA